MNSLPLLHKRLSLGCLIFFCLVVLSSGLQVYVFNNTTLYGENNRLENLQALILAISSITFFVMAFRGKRNDRLLVLFFSLLSFSFMLRELDIERLELPQIIIFLGSGTGRDALMGLGFTALVLAIIVHRNDYNKILRAFLYSPVFRLLTLSALCLISGDIFEESSLTFHVYFEELAELLGYLFLLISAINVPQSVDLKSAVPLFPIHFAATPKHHK